jgi:hypothetical protein
VFSKYALARLEGIGLGNKMHTYKTKEIPALRLEILARKSVLPEKDLELLDCDRSFFRKPTVRQIPLVRVDPEEPLDILDEWILPND